MRWPRSKSVQALIALLVAIPLSWKLSILTALASGQYIARKYPHDGQIGLMALMIFIVAIPVFAVLVSLALYFLQRTYVKDVPTQELE